MIERVAKKTSRRGKKAWITVCREQFVTKNKKYFGQKLKDHLSSKGMQANRPRVFTGLAFSVQGSFTAMRTCERERRPASELAILIFEWLKGVCSR